ncbi:MAG TPA: SusC/RagA family TonB-linked outer membrane protein [Cyclobacteriaceae bacterium]|nr:SusC/RagA family TonB-linked outer membrane protein [Cyclobacteriaceae bacterium]
MIRLIKVFMLLMVLFASKLAMAQITVSGIVKSGEDQSPIPGVNILVKGTTNGTITDARGSYNLTVASPNEILVFSFVGFITQEAALNGRTSLDVSLATDATQLSEVVVTALGIEKDKSKIGYSTQDVKASQLNKAREPNPINSLVGKVAGLNVGSSAELIGAPVVSLRGRSNILYVVDGVPINSDTWNISPDDIDTYTVLKGPSASALYGTRGVNGAIIITTKKGSDDKRGFSIDFNTSNMWDNTFLTIPKVQDEYGPGDHGRYAFADGKGGGLYDSDYDIWGPRFDGQLIPQYDGVVDPNNTYTTTFPSGTTFTGNIIPTPWTARGADNLERFLRPGFLSTNNIAVSASGQNYDLRFSYSHNYQQGQVPNTNLNSDNFNVTTGFDFSDKLRLESNINYNRQYSENFPDVQYGPNSMIYNITIWGGADWDIDDMKSYWQKGKEGVQQIYADYTRYNNPYFLTNEWLRGHQKTDIYGYMSLKYDITDYLQVLGRTAISTYELFRNEKFPYSATVYGREQAKGDYREDYRNLFDSNSDLLITFNKDVTPDINLTASVGGNLRAFDYRSSYITTDYLNVPASSLTPGAYTFDNSLNPIKAYNFKAPMNVYSFYYTLDFSFRDWLTLSTTGRQDNNSTLYPSETKYFFPSASMSIVLSEALKLPAAISMLKLRGAYAKVGEGFTTATIGATPNAPYPLDYGSSYRTPYGGPTYGNQAVYSTPLVYNNQPGAYYPNTLTNPDLKPYFTSATEVGMDVRFLNDRIGLDVTYFNNIDGPQISNQPLSETTGYTGYIANGAKTQRKGLEIVVNAKPLDKPNGLNWNILLNYGSFKETLKELPDGADRLGFIKIGDRVDAYYAGAFYKTPDGQLINDASGRPIRTAVSQFLGNTNPDWSWGITNRLNYKNWGLVFQFDGRVGGILVDYIQRQTFRGGRHIETVQGEMGIARAQDALGVKSYVGDGVVISNGAAIEYDPITGAITNYDELQFAPNTTATFLQDWISRYYAAEEANVISRSYAKLREVTLTYNFPSAMLERSFIRKASISLVGRNLLYFAEKKDVDIDQFVAPDSYSSLQSPTLRRYGFNVNITF